MCIAIYKPQGFVLTEETIKQSWRSNSDGAGFMYHEDNQLHIVKGLMTLPDFEEAYQPHAEKDCVLHFRIKTHGNKDQENTHPFNIDDNLGVVHNGIISAIDTSSDLTKSDTWHFAHKHLHEFRNNNPQFFLNPKYKDMIESYIGFSKLIFMDEIGNVEIFNESKGVWDSGCWFSNTSYKPPKVYPPRNYKTETGGNHWKNKELPKIEPKQKPMMAGDTCRVVFGFKALEGWIPHNSYVKINYFKDRGLVSVTEVLTGFTAEIHLTYLAPLGSTQEELSNDFDYLSV